MKLKLKKYILLSVLVVSGLFACKKDTDEVKSDGSSVYVKDLPGDVDASMGSTPGKEQRPFKTLIYSLTDGSSHLLATEADEVAYLKTNKWDLAFTGPYNSEVFLNNSKNEFNPGFGGPAANSSIVMLEQSYDSVNSAPDDSVFDKSSIIKVGWSSSSSSPGWFFYSLNNHICVPIKNRSYALRLPNGKYAKLEIQNIYKGNPPVVTDLFWPSPYISFRYYVQPDGSKNLRTK